MTDISHTRLPGLKQIQEAVYDQLRKHVSAALVALAEADAARARGDMGEYQERIDTLESLLAAIEEAL